MALQEQLDKIHTDFLTQAPEQATRLDADTEALVRRGVGREAPHVGEIAPDFELPDQLGHMIRSADLRAGGALVISFYRGNWCPYCSLQLRALQLYLPQIADRGASLVAISPQVPDESLTTIQKNELSFTVLSDVGNQVARQFGLVFTLSESVRPIYAGFGVDLPKYNGDQTFELPVPATFVIDHDATILAAHVNADYKQRMEPTHILDALAKVKV